MTLWWYPATRGVLFALNYAEVTETHLCVLFQKAKSTYHAGHDMFTKRKNVHDKKTKPNIKYKKTKHA